MMSLERLAEIERRDEDAGDLLQTAPFVVARRDRRELLAEVKRLRKLLAKALAEAGERGRVTGNAYADPDRAHDDISPPHGGNFAPMATQAYLDMDLAIAQSFADENDDT
jgi:hypothetical protein